MRDTFDRVAKKDKDSAGKGLGEVFARVAPERTIGDTATDIGIDLLKGAISVPESFVGLADIPTGGRVGKGLESIGYKPAEAKEILSDQYSPARKAAGQKVNEAQGLVDTVSAAIQNPSVIASGALESLPLMGAGGVVGRGLGILGKAGKMSGVLRGAVGEGAVSAGMTAEQIRGETDDKLLSPSQSALAAASGAATALFAQLGGKLAQKAGIGDVDTYLARLPGEEAKRVKKNLVRRAVEGFVSEGVFEELPQSVQEEIAQNVALGKPAFEGVDQAAALGMLSGGLIGGGFNALNSAGTDTPADESTPPADVPAKPPGPLANAAAAGGIPGLGDTLRTHAFVPDDRRGPEAARLRARDETKAQFEDNLAGLNTRSRGIPSSASQSAEVFAAAGPTELEKQVALRTQREAELEQTFSSLQTEEQQTANRDKAKDEAGLDPIHNLRTEIKKRGGLNLDNLKVDYDNETTKALIKKLPGIVKRGGAVELDDIADEMRHYGYKSADDLLRALVESPTRREAEARAVKGIDAGYGHDNRLNESADELDSKGFEPVFAQRPAVDLNLGDKVVTGQDANLPADEYEVKGETSDGRIILEDGVRREVDAFDALNIEGIKRSGKQGFGVPGAVEPSAPVRQPGSSSRESKGVGGDSSPASTEQVTNPASTAHGQEVNTSPSEPMKKAENYKKAHVNVDGHQISIENPVGSMRSGQDDAGKRWEQELKADYGYFKGTVGYDKDHVDTFIKPGYKGGSETVHIVNQHKKDGSFDEHKVVMGADSSADALAVYNQNYESGWTGGKSVVAMPAVQFGKWVKSDAPKTGELLDGEARGLATIEQIKALIPAKKHSMIREQLAEVEELLAEGAPGYTVGQWAETLADLADNQEKWKFGDKNADRPAAEAIIGQVDPAGQYGISYDFKQRGGWAFTIRDLNGRVNGEPLGEKDMDGTFTRISKSIFRLTPSELLKEIAKQQDAFGIIDGGATSDSEEDTNSQDIGPQADRDAKRGKTEPEAGAFTPDESEVRPQEVTGVIKAKDVYGNTHYISQAQLDSGKTLLRRLNKKGEPLEVENTLVHRDNIDLTGGKTTAAHKGALYIAGKEDKGYASPAMAEQGIKRLGQDIDDYTIEEVGGRYVAIHKKVSGGNQKGANGDVRTGKSQPDQEVQVADDGDQSADSGRDGQGRQAELRIEELSEKAIIIKGNTREHKDRIKSASPIRALWNKGKGGWVFPKNREAEIRESLKDLLGEEANTQPSQPGESAATDRSVDYSWAIREPPPQVSAPMVIEPRVTVSYRGRELSGKGYAVPGIEGLAVKVVPPNGSKTDSTKMGWSVWVGDDLVYVNPPTVRATEHLDTAQEAIKVATPKLRRIFTAMQQGGFSGVAQATGDQQQEAEKQTPDASDTSAPSGATSSPNQPFVDAIATRIEEWVSTGTNGGARALDRQWERGAVKRFYDSYLKGSFAGSKTGEWASAKVAAGKADSFDGLKAALAKLVAVKPAPSTPVIPQKEPWQMTRAEYLAAPKTGDKYDGEAFRSGRHSESVRNAIQNNESVPVEVLADYPGLQVKETPESLTKQPVKGKDTPKEQEVKLKEQLKGFGESNKKFTAADAEEARRIMREQLGQLNMGLNPEMLKAGITLAGFYIEGGARSFSDYAKKMVADFGDAIKPHLRQFYEAIRQEPGFDTSGMTTYAELELRKDVPAVESAPDSRSLDAVADYEVIFADENLRLQFQDELDDLFNHKILALARALRDRGWTMDRSIDRLFKDGKRAAVELTQVGAGKNVVGLSVNGVRVEPGVNTADTANRIDATLAAGFDKAQEKADTESKEARDDTEPQGSNEGNGGAIRSLAPATSQSGDQALAGMAAEDGGDAGQGKQADLFGAGRGRKSATRDKRADGGRDAAPRSKRADAETVHPPGAGERSFGEPGTGRVEPAAIPGKNFKITKDLKLGEGSEEVKFQDNLAAISTLKRIEGEQRRATAEEQRTLARYVGWGGLANAFANPVTGDIREGWQGRVKDLAGLLTDNELTVARNSTKAAHYTSEAVASQMWEAVKRLGFKRGNVLEPSMGIGNFIGLTPEGVTANVMGIEYDPITARIGKLLYPQATVIHSGFQQVPLPEGVFDLVIGNPPFGQESLNFQHSPHLNRHSIHNQFFLAGIDALRPGGIQAMVVSRYLMDSKDSGARDALAAEAKLLGVVRLPESAFKENARTDVVTDIIFLQKKTEEEIAATEKEEAPAWTKSTEIEVNGEQIAVNKYFQNNPRAVIGTMTTASSQFSGASLVVKLEKGADLAKLINERTGQILPAGVFTQESTADQARDHFETMRDGMEIALAGHEDASIAFNDLGELVQVHERETEGGDFVLAKRVIGVGSPWSPHLAMDKDGNWFREVDKLDEKGNKIKVADENGKLTKRNAKKRQVFKDVAEIPQSMTMSKLDYGRLRDAVSLLDELVAQVNLEISDAPSLEIEGNRKQLRRAYDAFVKKHDRVNAPVINKLISDLPNGPLLMALETVYKPPIRKDRAEKLNTKPRPAIVKEAAILDERVVFPYESPTSVESASDALAVVLSESGRVDLGRVADLLGQGQDEVIKALHHEAETPLIFLDPETQEWETADEYLGGNVVKKLAAAKGDSGYPKNVDALEAVQPKAWTADQVTPTLGSTWIPTDVYAGFIASLTGKPAKVNFSPLTNTYAVQGEGGTPKAQNWNTPKRNVVEIIEAVLNSRPIRITETIGYGSEKRTVTDQDNTDLANEKGEEIREAFDDWVFQDAGRRKQLVDIFNQKFNVRVVKQRDGQHLKLPGKVPDSVIKMRRHQLNGIWRGIVDRFVLYDHAVGAGKTFTGIARAMERRRMGLSRKPLVVVPNHLVEQFAADAYKLYPGAKVLAAGSKDLNPKKRRRMLGKIATGEWDLVIMPHSSFKFVGISPDTESRFLEEQLRLAEQAIAEAQQQAEEDGLAGHRKPITVKEAERLRDTIQGRLDKLRTRGNKKDRMLSFEQLGVDDLTIDEAHEFKNLFYHSKLSVRGMNPKEGSARAYDLWTKVRVLQESKTGSVAFMTGTPISNSAVEMYGLMRYLAADVLADMNLEHFDAWRSQFTTVTTKYEPTDSGRGLKEVNRIGRDWSNMRALMDAYYTFSDSVSNGDIQAWYSEDNDGARFPIPEVKGGGRQQVNVAPTEAQERIIQEVVARYEGLDGIKDVKERNKERLRLMDRARKVSLDVRVVDPATDSKERGGKLDAVARQVHQIYHEWREDKGTQLVFLDRSVPKAKGDAGKIQKYDALLRDLEAAERKGDDDKARAVIGKLEKYDYNEMQELKIAQTGSWNAYRQIKENLVGLGIPENEIRFIQEANTDEQKKTMFDEVNAGQIRVLIGSTPRLGAGTNVQERLVALHHVDVTWKPSDIEQREGRIIRQGNSLFAKYGGSFKVIINAYTTDTTVDQRLWDLNATKMRMINGIRKYNGDFNMEFVDEDSVSMAEIAAHASGNPLQLERVQLAAEIDRLNRSKRSFARQQWGQKDALEEAEANIKILPETIRALAPEAEKIAAEIAMVAEEVKSRTVTIDGKEYDRGPWGSNAHDALAEKRDQAKKKKEKFEADINGKVFTSFQDASAAIDDVMGDGANFDVELDGEKFIRHRRAIGKVVELANAVIDKEGKGAEVDYTPLAKMRAYGVDIDLAIQVVDDGKGRTIEFHFTGKKEANGQPLTLVRSIYEANLGVDYYAHSAMYGMFSRPLNDVTSIPNRLKQSRKRLAEAKEMAPELRKLVDKPYPKEQELSDKKDRLNAVEQELSNSAAPSKGKTTDDGEVKLSQSSSPRSGQLSTARTLQSIVDSYLTSSGRRDLQVSVVQTVDQLRAGLVLSEGVSGNVEGAFDPQSGKVFLVADNIATTEAWGRILHEITHKTRAEQGWGGVFGREAETILNEIDKRLAAGATAWKKAEQQARQARTSAENLREETITYFLAEQANSNQSLWRRIVNAIRAWAVRVGLKRKVSDADIVALAENSVQSRARSTVSEMESAGDTVPAFSESNDIRYSQAELAAAAKAFFSKKNPFLADKANEWLDKADPKWRDRWENIVYMVADKDDPKRLIQNRYGEQSEETDYLMAERLRGKQTAAEVEKLAREEVNPLLEFLAKSKLEIADLEEYAMVKHVPERNAQMRRINAKQYLGNMTALFTGKKEEELRYEIGNAAAEIDREDRRDSYLDLLAKEFAGLDDYGDKVRAGREKLEAREFTAEEIDKGTPERLERNQRAAERRVDQLLKLRGQWGDRSLRFAGMTDAEAAEILDKWEADRRYPEVEQARKQLAKINDGRLVALIEGGEITKDQANQIRSTYKYYVPFNREGFSDGKPATGRSTGPLGKAIKGASGSLRRVVDILAHSVANRQAAISRKHKALVGRKLYNLVRENPDPDNWWIEEQPKEAGHDQDGNVTFHNQFKEPANGVPLKLDGKIYTVMVNREDNTMMRMVESIKNMDVGMGPFIRALSKINRLLAALNTSFSPEFILTNLLRDMQTAGINLEDSEGRGAQKQIFKNMLTAIKGIYKAERGTDSEWGKKYRDFEKNGGKIGWMQSYDTIEDLASGLGEEMKLYQEGHTAKKTVRKLHDLLKTSNTAIENGVRLATYDYLVNTKGLNKRKAALIASNLTVDFTRRGAAGPNINALYMFANAGIQGNIRMIKAAVRSGRVRTMLGAIVGTGFIMHLLALATGGDDDDGMAFYDKVPDSMKERNMIVMLQDGKRVTVPMPYGYNIFFNLGDELAEMMVAAMAGREYKQTKGVARMFSVFSNTFNPMSSATLLQTVLPTALDPVGYIAENKTWFGGDLMPSGNPFATVPEPNSQRFWKSVSPISKAVAQSLNRLTGGDAVKPGLIDVSPEVLDLIIDTYSGSAGRFVKDTMMLPVRAATGQLEANKTPIARRFYGEQFEGVNSGIYREQVREVMTVHNQYLAEPDRARRQEIKGKELFGLIPLVKESEKVIGKLRKIKKIREGRGDDTTLLEDQIERIQKKVIARYRQTL